MGNVEYHGRTVWPDRREAPVSLDGILWMGDKR